MSEVVDYKDYYEKKISKLYIGDNLQIDRISDKDLYIINSLELWLENEINCLKIAEKGLKTNKISKNKGEF